MTKKKCGCSSSKNISCKSYLDGTFVRIDGIKFTATMSATGSGSNCEKAKLDSEKNIYKTLEEFLDGYSPKIINKTYSINTECDDCPKPLVLYYRVTVSPSDNSFNFNITRLSTNPDIPTHFSAIPSLYMTESDFVTYNKDVLTGSQFRIPKNPLLPDYLQTNIFYETCNIKLSNGDFVQGVATYDDPGTDAITNVSYVVFIISASSGIFKKYKSFKVKYYNKGDPPGYNGLGPVRTITFE